jgi:hypothetical protein
MHEHDISLVVQFSVVVLKTFYAEVKITFLIPIKSVLFLVAMLETTHLYSLDFSVGSQLKLFAIPVSSTFI